MVGNIKINLMKENIIDKADFYIVDNGSILVEYDSPNEIEPMCITYRKLYLWNCWQIMCK